MAADSFNPFALPGGLGSMGSHPLLSGMDMMQQAWGGLAGSQGLANGLPLTAGLDPQELDRRIAELKTVQGWLQFNLSMLGNTIQSLEVQRATMAALQGFSDGLLAAVRTTGQATTPDASQAGAGQDGTMSEAAAPTPQAGTASGATAPKPQAETVRDAAQAVSTAFGQSSQAWWDTLTTQFTQILDMVRVNEGAAAGTPASSPAQAVAPASAAVGKPAAARKKMTTARKKTTVQKPSSSTSAAGQPATRKPGGGRSVAGKATAAQSATDKK